MTALPINAGPAMRSIRKVMHDFHVNSNNKYSEPTDRKVSRIFHDNLISMINHAENTQLGQRFIGLFQLLNEVYPKLGLGEVWALGLGISIECHKCVRMNEKSPESTIHSWRMLLGSFR
jgi:hypothetical protein